MASSDCSGLQLVGRICNASITGDGIKSVSVGFEPNRIIAGAYEADTKTAGSICLLMQIAVPCLCFVEPSSMLTLKGGTDAEMAPSIDYYMKVFLPVVKQFGIDVNCELVRRGFYPQGNGEVKVFVNPIKSCKSVAISDFGELKRIFGYAFVAGRLPNKIAHTMANSAAAYIKKTIGISADIETSREHEDKAFATGCAIIIIAETSTGCLLSGYAVGKKGKPAEEVGLEAAYALCEDISFHACVDRHLQDQLIIFMALASGKSKIKVGPITLHTETAIYIAETITKAKFTIQNVGDKENIISCEGIGFNSGS